MPCLDFGLYHILILLSCLKKPEGSKASESIRPEISKDFAKDHSPPRRKYQFLLINIPVARHTQIQSINHLPKAFIPKCPLCNIPAVICSLPGFRSQGISHWWPLYNRQRPPAHFSSADPFPKEATVCVVMVVVAVVGSFPGTIWCRSCGNTIEIYTWSLPSRCEMGLLISFKRRTQKNHFTM